MSKNTDQKIIKNKMGLLNLADMLGSVSEACKVMGYSRDSFYTVEAHKDVKVLGVTDYMSIANYSKLRAFKAGGRISNIELLIANIEFRIAPPTDKATAVNIHLLVSPDEPQHEQEILNALGRLHWRYGIESPTWYANPGGRWHLTPAGWWYVFVSIPILQFLLLRWYFRFFIWYRFLWRVSKLNLHLVPIHPDRSAGLAFLGKSAYAFGPILFAQGAMLAGLVASRVLYRGESLLSFKLQMGGFVVFFVLAILGPLLMFTPRMAAAKRKGLADYAQVAQGYVDGFEEKWVLNTLPSEEVLGSGDIQSLADLNNSYDIVRSMRAAPFGLDDISRLAAATAAPLAPLLLTVFPPEELIMRLVKVVF